MPPIKVALNISPVQLQCDNFADRFIHAIQTWHFDAERFEIELSEQGLLKAPQDIALRIRPLQDFGVTVAIDNFGRGYSSLSYLRHMPVDTLKIDRSFVRDIEENESARLVDGIAMMAKGLKLNLVAEGVESRHQLEYVKRLGCHEVQGFLYAAAVNADEAMTMLQSGNGGRPRLTLLD